MMGALLERTLHISFIHNGLAAGVDVEFGEYQHVCVYVYSVDIEAHARSLTHKGGRAHAKHSLHDYH